MTGRVTARDVLDSGYCVKGLRTMLESHGVDFHEFVRDGIPIDDLSGMDDAIVQRVVETARRRVASEENLNG